jgi:hypothetical protein
MHAPVKSVALESRVICAQVKLEIIAVDRRLSATPEKEAMFIVSWTTKSLCYTNDFGHFEL